MKSVAGVAWNALAHPIGTSAPILELPWRDNAFFAFWDVKQRVHGLLHVMTSPNSGGRRAIMSIAVDGAGQELIEPLASGSFCSDSISFGLDGRITVNAGQIRVALQLEPIFAAGDYTGSEVFPGVSAAHPLNHWEQVVSVKGSVTLGARTAEVNCYGVRDRIWGYRDESVAFQQYIAIMVAFVDHGLTMLKFRDADGCLRAHGFLLGDPYGVVELSDVKIGRNPAGLLASAEIDCADGPLIELRVRDRHQPGFWLHMANVSPPDASEESRRRGATPITAP